MPRLSTVWSKHTLRHKYTDFPDRCDAVLLVVFLFVDDPNFIHTHYNHFAAFISFYVLFNRA